MSIQTASSWPDLYERIFAESWDAKIQRHRSRHAFRGVSAENYKLESSLMRLGGPYKFLEPHLLRNFKKYAHRSIVERDSLWHWISVAQHHGLLPRASSTRDLFAAGCPCISRPAIWEATPWTGRSGRSITPGHTSSFRLRSANPSSARAPRSSPSRCSPKRSNPCRISTAFRAPAGTSPSSSNRRLSMSES